MNTQDNKCKNGFFVLKKYKMSDKASEIVASNNKDSKVKKSIQEFFHDAVTFLNKELKEKELHISHSFFGSISSEGEMNAGCHIRVSSLTTNDQLSELSFSVPFNDIGKDLEDRDIIGAFLYTKLLAKLIEHFAKTTIKQVKI